MRGLDLKDVGLKDNIYIVKATDGRNTFVKLGFSNSIKKRLVTYLQCNPFTEIVGTWLIEDGKTFEYMVHKNLESVAFNEWYGEDALPTLLNWIENGVPKNLTDKVIASKITNIPDIPEYLSDFPAKLWKRAFRGTGSFTELARLYYQYVMEGRDEAAKYVGNLEPILEDAQKTLGIESIRGLSFQKSKIRKALITAKSDRSASWKVAKYLNLQEGLWYSSEDILKKLQSACKANGTNVPKSSTKISEYYISESKTRRINGIPTRGFIIVGSKFK